MIGTESCLLTQVEFDEEDHEAAERIARRLGYTQTAYTSTSALWGLFCLRDRASQRAGCVVKTKELGLLFVQGLEDLNMHDEYEREVKRDERTRRKRKRGGVR